MAIFNAAKDWQDNLQVADDPEYHYFPNARDLPVIVAVRMSLSFPGLLTAVPLYTRDFTLRKEEEQQKPRMCWFSDGGISSNFPIHFFDRLWPGVPTFGISLDQYAEDRHGDDRVYLPQAAREGMLLGVDSIKGIGQFVMAIFNAAKDWQDNLQSILPGYRERIAHVVLKPDEGGINLTMPRELIRMLSGFGAEAGKLMQDFEMDEHRWRRFLIALASTETIMEEMHHAYTTESPGRDDFADFLARYPENAGSYAPVSKVWLDSALNRTQEMMDCAERWAKAPLRHAGKIPRPDCNIRITPKE